LKGGSRLAVSRAGKNRVELLEEISEILLERCGFEQDLRQTFPRWIVRSNLVRPRLSFLKPVRVNQQMYGFAGCLGRLGSAWRFLAERPQRLDPFFNWVFGIVLLPARFLEISNLLAGLPQHRVDLIRNRLPCRRRLRLRLLLRGCKAA